MYTPSNHSSVQVIDKAINPYGQMIATLKLRYPRPIHSEFMTHRVMSKNASSSRAIPVVKLAVTTSEDYYVPRFRKNQPGMRPGEYLAPNEQEEAEFLWKRAMNECIRTAEELGRKEGLNVHKQWANRMLEWFGYINVQVTSTQWSNFFALRTEADEAGWPVPQDEMYDLACMMKRELEAAPVKHLSYGDWYLPWVTDEERTRYTTEECIKLSVARSASISYETVDGQPMTPERALILHDKLLAKHPIHASPAEHQARVDSYCDQYGRFENEALSGNLGPGWIQYRKTIPGECL